MQNIIGVFQSHWYGKCWSDNLSHKWKASFCFVSYYPAPSQTYCNRRAYILVQNDICSLYPKFSNASDTSYMNGCQTVVFMTPTRIAPKLLRNHLIFSALLQKI